MTSDLRPSFQIIAQKHVYTHTHFLLMLTCRNVNQSSTHKHTLFGESQRGRGLLPHIQPLDPTITMADLPNFLQPKTVGGYGLHEASVKTLTPSHPRPALGHPRSPKHTQPS